MPTLTGPDGAAYYAPTSAPTKSTIAASSKPNPNNAKRPPANNPSSRPALSPSPNDGSPPSPPPGAPEIQLKMWHAVLVRRKRQMQQLSHADLLSYANDIIADLLSTRYEANDYSRENRQDGSDKVDLVAGHFSSFLLTQQPPPADLSADEIGLHLLALFYRSMDDRLTNAMRKHGIDAVRRACERLEFWLAKGEAVQKSSTDCVNSEKRKRKSMDSVGTGSSNPSSGQPSNTFGDGSGGGRGGNNKTRQACRFFARGKCARGDCCWFSHETGGQNDGTNDAQNKPRAENASRRSTDREDGSNKRMRKDPPVLNDDSAMRVSGMAQRPGKVFLPPQPQGGDDNEGGKSEKGERKDPPQVSGSEKRPGKIFLPPQPHQQRMNRNSLEKDKARTNNNHAVPTQQAAVATQKIAPDERDKSKKGERNNDHPQPKQSDVRIPRASGSRQSIGNRFSPPQPTQQGPYETLQLDGSARGGPSSSYSPFPPQQGPTTSTQNRPQRKDPPQTNQTNGGQRTQTHMPPQPQQGRRAHSSRKETSSHPSSSVSASQRMNSNDVISHKQRDVAMAQNQPMGNNERQGNVMNHSIAAEGVRVRQGTEKTKKPKTTAPRPSAESQKELSPTFNAKNTDTGNESDDDVIDLTCDSPPYESPPSMKSPSVAAKAPSTSNRAIKQCDEESTGKNRAVPQRRPPSPPASPLPLATIHNPPPSAQPRPKPFSERRSVIFDADVNPTASGSLKGRPSCIVSFDAGFHLDGSGSCLNDALCIDVSERLMTWDPYWKIVEELGTRKVLAPTTQRGHGMTSVGTRTTPCVPAHQKGPVSPDHPSSCASLSVDLPREISRSKLSNRDSSGKSLGQGYRPWGVRWGSLSHPYTDEKGRQRDRLQTGDRRLIIRTLPLQRTSKDIKKRADGHLWPKGTFLQLEHGNTEQVLSILQRKQQSHDLSEWKGMSHPLDLTVEIKNKNMPIDLRLCSKEVVENSATNDGAVKGTLAGSYALHVAICEYVAPDDLYDRLMGKAAGDVTIPRISLRSARKMAKEYLAGQMVSIEDSDDDENNSKGDQGNNPEDAKSLTFSLLCPISKTAMHTPVRSRHCKHMQCMDLRVFLHANKNITGGRWRCGACEDFVNVRDLVHCGLFQAMLDSLGSQVSGARDRVSLRSDGNWKLMDENRLRYSKRGGSLSTGTKMEADAVDSGGKRPSSGPEVIELL